MNSTWEQLNHTSLEQGAHWHRHLTIHHLPWTFPLSSLQLLDTQISAPVLKWLHLSLASGGIQRVPVHSRFCTYILCWKIHNGKPMLAMAMAFALSLSPLPLWFFLLSKLHTNYKPQKSLIITPVSLMHSFRNPFLSTTVGLGMLCVVKNSEMKQ